MKSRKSLMATAISIPLVLCALLTAACSGSAGGESSGAEPEAAQVPNALAPVNTKEPLSIRQCYPTPAQVQIQQWGRAPTHVWAQLYSSDQLAITYRYSYDYGNTWSPWENDGYYYFWPYVGPLGYPSGAIQVQAFVTNSYNCSSRVVQGAYVF